MTEFRYALMDVINPATNEFAKPIAPKRQTDGAAGFDIATPYPVKSMTPRSVNVINTGILPIIPEGYVGKLYVRSSMSNRGLCLPHGVGIIDADYRGALMVPLKNTSDYPVLLEGGERIAQLVIVPLPTLTVTEIDIREHKLLTTARGEGGFGSTGRV